MEGQAVPPKADTCPLTCGRVYVVDAESVVVWKAWHRDLLLLPEPVKNWPPAQTVREFWLRQVEKQAASRPNPSSRRGGQKTRWRLRSCGRRRTYLPYGWATSLICSNQMSL